MRISTTRRLVIVSMLSAMAFILQLVGSAIGLKVAGFLEIEISDLPAIIGTLSFGPSWGVIIELIKNLLHTFVTSTGYVGELANFLVNGCYVFVLGMFYKHNKTKKGAITGFVFATLIYSLFGAFVNYFILVPAFAPQMPASARLPLVITTITPFNLVKGFVLACITILIYKRCSSLIRGNTK